MRAVEPTQDPRDKAFGAAASRDPDKPIRHPRAGGEAEPAGIPAENETGAEKAAQNREEDPPA